MELTSSFIDCISPVRIGNGYHRRCVLEIQRRLDFQFTETSVSVADLQNSRQSGSRYLTIDRQRRNNVSDIFANMNATILKEKYNRSSSIFNLNIKKEIFAEIVFLSS